MNKNVYWIWYLDKELFRRKTHCDDILGVLINKNVFFRFILSVLFVP